MKKQSQAIARLERDTRAAGRALENQTIAQVLALWKATKVDIGSAIASTYRADFSARTWDIAMAKARGTLPRIQRAAHQRLDDFYRQTKELMGASAQLAYQSELVRQAWMMDQLTPRFAAPSLGGGTPSREARRRADAPQDYKAGWQQALDAWVGAYEDGLAANLQLEALHEGSPDDAASEVDATRIGGFDPAYKFAQMVSSEFLDVQQVARDDFAAANTDLVAEEIWMTMEDGRVCPICHQYDGHKREDVDDDIPAHFNCRCYYRIVPKPWAELLRGGSRAEKELALRMDDVGLVPDSMAIIGAKGQLIGTAAVRFDDWIGGRALELYGDNIAGRIGTASLR